MSLWKALTANGGGRMMFPRLNRLIGMRGGILVSQMLYWYTHQNTKHPMWRAHAGKWWISRTNEQWQEDCAFTDYGFREAVTEASRFGVVSKTVLQNHKGVPVTHLWLDMEALAVKLDQVEYKEELAALQSPAPHGLVEGQQIHSLTVNESLYKETSNKTTKQASKLAQGKSLETFTMLSGKVKNLQTNPETTPKSGNGIPAELVTVEETLENVHTPTIQTIKTSTKFVKSSILEQVPIPITQGTTMKAHEILEMRKNQPKGAAVPKVTGVGYLEMVWKKHMAELTPDFVKALTGKEKGQLKLFLQKVGPERATWALEYAMEHWTQFTWEVKKAKGKSLVPELPVPGFVLEHHDTLLQLIAKQQSAQDTATPVKSSQDAVSVAPPESAAHEAASPSPTPPTAEELAAKKAQEKAEQYALYLKAMEDQKKGHTKE